MSMIRFCNVCKQFNTTDKPVLSHFSEEIGDGEFVVLTGRSGIGKTTLIKLLLRELPVDSGSIYVDDEDIAALPESQIPYYRRKLGVIFQDFKLVAERTVYDNLVLTRRIYGWGSKETESRIENVLHFLGIDHLHKRYPVELSGGEQQKLCLARAILNDPKVLLADEPTRNLDPRASREFVHLMELIHRQGVTILMATHDMETIKQEALDYRELALPETKGNEYA